MISAPTTEKSGLVSNMIKILYWYSITLLNVGSTILNCRSGNLTLVPITGLMAVIGMAFTYMLTRDFERQVFRGGPVGLVGPTGAMGMSGRDCICKCKCVK